MKSEFEEIAHSGGKITFSIKTDEDGCPKFHTRYKHSRAVPMTLIAVYALPQGVPVDSIQLGGIGQPWNPPPFPGCLSVLIASDSQGYFGHNCARCDGYWRSGPWPRVCPYCAVWAPSHQFLSKAQRRYVKHYCDIWSEALESDNDQEVEIDMDAVADAAGKQGEKPAFYVAEESQQQKFNCVACGEFNDILGRFGYCAHCGTRNDYAEFENEMLRAVRERLNSGTPPEDCVRAAVASFDSFTGQLVKELAKIVPMTPRRKKRLLGQRFHNIEEVAERLNQWFDIDTKEGIRADEWRRVGLMFFRRHVYEHNGGEVDQKYLDDSGDKTVRLKQSIHETKQNVHQFLDFLLKMARNLHNGFHKIFPPINEPIESFNKTRKLTEQRLKGKER